MTDQEDAVGEGDLLYTPSPESVRQSNLTRYMAWLRRERNLDFADYASLHAWSVRDLGAFWRSIVDFFEVEFHDPEGEVLRGTMPDAHWFPGASLNYAEYALKKRDDELALIAVNEAGARVTMTRAQLAERVARAASGLGRLGVHVGDRVAAFLPNVADTLVLFLAAASLGATWSSCSPEFGVGSVLDRFKQIEPKVLLASVGYRYGGKTYDRSQAVRQIARGLESLEHVVEVPVLGGGSLDLDDLIGLDELMAHHEELRFESVPFEHPLWVLYSSGTTGLPKPIVQGHGGILLEHLKALSLHCDLKADDRFFWFTTTGWMMWNFLISGLLVGTPVVLYDGSPAHPDLGALWAMAEREAVTYFGTSAPYLIACKKAGLRPNADHDLGRVRALGTTGAPLPADGFGWVYQNVSQTLHLGSVSGGTDVCTAFVLSCPHLPVHAGEIQVNGLGCKVEAYDPDGKPVLGEVGELVLSAPMPSMPVFFWGDDDGSRYRDSYFSVYPGVWRHGDWIKFTEHGGSIIYGRSDSTLNRGGVRMGTSEFYRLIEGLDAIADSLVVDTGSLDVEGKLLLFVVLARGHTLNEELVKRIGTLLRSELSPRHVPDEIRAVRSVPRTLNGKKMEVPIKRIFNGVPVERAVNRDTLSDPNALDEYVALAAELSPSS